MQQAGDQRLSWRMSLVGSIGQRIVAVLETGLRTATYKLATLMSLIDYAIEHTPENPQETLVVPIPDLAHRVLELYWRQVRPLEGKPLMQSTQRRARIPRAALELRRQAGEDTAADALLLRSGRPAKHAAILVTAARMVHAFEGAGVVEVHCSPWWRRRVAGAFRFPAVSGEW
jgi:hypothetical protein